MRGHQAKNCLKIHYAEQEVQRKNSALLVEQSYPVALSRKHSYQDMKLLFKFLHGPCEFFKEVHRDRTLLIPLFSILFVCILLAMVWSVARRTNPSEHQASIPKAATLKTTSTKWWVRINPSPTPTSVSKQSSQVGTPVVTAISGKCPT